MHTNPSDPPPIPATRRTMHAPAPRRASTRPQLPADGSADGHALAEGAVSADVQQALQQLQQVQALAAAGQCHGIVLCEALTEAARALASVHAYGPADSCLAQALQAALLLGTADLQADLHCALAEVATNAADLAQLRGQASGDTRRRARDHAHAAVQLASHTADPHWEVKLLLRASDVLDRCGRHDDALAVQQRALVLIGLHEHDLQADASTAQAPLDALRVAAPSTLM